MSRAEMRRQRKKEERSKTVTYNFTEAQLDAVIKNRVEEVYEQMRRETKIDAAEQAINTTMTLLLTLPLEVLMKYYWPKTYKKKLPEFTQHVLDHYEMWIDGKLDLEELQEHLWEYAGFRLEESEV